MPQGIMRKYQNIELRLLALYALMNQNQYILKKLVLNVIVCKGELLND